MKKYQKGSVLVTALIAIVAGIIIGHFIWPKGSNTTILGKNASSTEVFAMTKSDTLRQDMRKLWTDHAVLTHSYIVSAMSNSPDKTAIATRLLKNQDDIGNAVATYYGRDAGNQLTTLLKSHITTAVDIVEDARTNNQAKLKTDSDTWNANGKEIADFLATANPNWPKADMESMMQKHLDTTTDELMARVNKDWEGEVKAFDTVYAHILAMADGLSDGIIKQFPNKFQ
jgi:hypothetical protein